MSYLPFVKRIFFKEGLPVQLIFFVTSRCNMRCAHCFLWRELNLPTDELSISEVERIAGTIPTLLSLSLTGGEPFLRPDLPELAHAFCSRTRVKHMTVFSNGLTPERVASMLERIALSCAPTKVSFGTSLEGLGADHDRVRGLPGAFDRTVETIRQVVKLKERLPNLSVGVVTTFNAKTQHSLQAISELVLRELKADDHTITLIRGDVKEPRLKELDISLYEKFFRDKREALKLDGSERSLLGCIITARELVASGVIAKVHKEGKRIIPCYGGRLTAILRENGDVYPCEMLSNRMGNIRDFNYNFPRLWSSRQAEEVRDFIDKTKCACTYECVLTPNLLFNVRNYPALLKEVLGLKLKR